MTYYVFRRNLTGNTCLFSHTHFQYETTNNHFPNFVFSLSLEEHYQLSTLPFSSPVGAEDLEETAEPAATEEDEPEEEGM